MTLNQLLLLLLLGQKAILKKYKSIFCNLNLLSFPYRYSFLLNELNSSHQGPAIYISLLFYLFGKITVGIFQARSVHTHSKNQGYDHLYQPSRPADIFMSSHPDRHPLWRKCCINIYRADQYEPDGLLPFLLPAFVFNGIMTLSSRLNTWGLLLYSIAYIEGENIISRVVLTRSQTKWDEQEIITNSKYR